LTGVTLGPDSNNSSRSLCSALIGCSKLAGGLGTCGQAIGLATSPEVLQAHSASPQASDSRRLGVLAIVEPSLILDCQLVDSRLHALFSLAGVTLCIGLGCHELTDYLLGTRVGPVIAVPVRPAVEHKLEQGECYYDRSGLQ
jgi:hypothetical protein